MSCCSSREFDGPAIYDFPPIRQGETFEPWLFEVQEDNGAALVSSELIFTAGGTSTAALTLTNTSGLTQESTEAGNWAVSINQFNVALAPGIYSYEFWTVDANGRRKPYATGNLPVN